jgi:hypothetical protein
MGMTSKNPSKAMARKIVIHVLTVFLVYKTNLHPAMAVGKSEFVSSVQISMNDEDDPGSEILQDPAFIAKAYAQIKRVCKGQFEGTFTWNGTARSSDYFDKGEVRLSYNIMLKLENGRRYFAATKQESRQGQEIEVLDYGPAEGGYENILDRVLKRCGS